MKDSLTLNSHSKRMMYGDSISYPHRMDYIRITENLSNRAAKNRDNGLGGSPAMWWAATAIVIISAMFLLCISI